MTPPTQPWNVGPAVRPTIELRSVSHRFGERGVLRDLNLTLTERRIAVIGANGSGKSTLVRLLNGLVVPTEGQVLVDGLDTRTEARLVRQRVGFMFTDPDAQIVMPTVEEDVAFGLRRSGLDRTEVKRRVAAALDRYGLADHADHPAHLLSGGQMQLLALAGVLVTEPDVLVCDEPTTLLDLRNTRMVTDLLTSLPQQVIVATHDLDFARRFERVLVIDDGRLVADAEPNTAVATYEALV